MRQLTAHAFIQLPILDDDDTGTLIQKLTVQTEGPGAPSVPTAAKDSFHEMVRAGEVLRAAAPSAVAIEGGRAHESHLKVQRSWSALERWLGSFTLLDDGEDPRVPAAKKLHGDLFGEGLGFANAKVEVEWMQSDKKIAAVAKAHLTKQFEELGGKVFWKRVIAAHEAEGVAAHLTVATQTASGPSQHEAAQAAQEAIKEYVAAIIGTVRAKKAETQKVADALLLPLATWTSSPRAAAPATPPVTPPITPT